MRKVEFIEDLKRQLTGAIPAHEIESTIRYYEDYISSNAVTEDEEAKRIEEIGDPRLIARTIIESYELSHSIHGATHNKEVVYEEYETSDGQTRDHRGNHTGKMEFEFDGKVPFKFKVIGVLSVVVLLIILYFLIRMLSFIVIRVLGPILLVGLIIALLSRIFRK